MNTSSTEYNPRKKDNPRKRYMEYEYHAILAGTIFSITIFRDIFWDKPL